MEGGRVGKGEQVLGFNIICFPLLAGLHTNQSIPGWLPQTGFAVVQYSTRGSTRVSKMLLGYDYV